MIADKIKNARTILYYITIIIVVLKWEKREKQMKMDSAVDDIRRRFGFYSIQRGLMYRDRILSAVNAKEEHTVQLLRTH